MLGFLIAPLMTTLSPHFDLSKTRLETLAIMLAGLANGRTVNLGHLSSQFPGKALLSSSYRRLQRFCQYVRLDEDVVARLILHLLNLKGLKLLALDRTNWKRGKTDINISVLALVTRRFKVPLMWSFLSHCGNSSTEQRIDLIKRYLRVFGASSVEVLLADREFVGEEWLMYLIENNVPFVIRLREDMYIETKDGRLFQFRSLLRKRHKGKWSGWLPGMERTLENLLRFEGRKIRGGALLLVATNIPASKNALHLYRKRWGIECLFADAKTRGFNIEDTHITDPAKLATLLAVVALAMTWAYRCASQAMGRKSIRKKAHKRRAKSWFRIGFDVLRRWILYDQQKALEAWRRTCPKRFSDCGFVKRVGVASVRGHGSLRGRRRASRWCSVVDRLQCRLRGEQADPRPNRFYEIDQPPSRRDLAPRRSGGNSDQAAASFVH